MAKGNGGGRKTPGKVVSRAQQKFLFASGKSFARRWSMASGEVGPHGKPSAASKAAYKKLPARKGARKKA
jgi:hypothetical protein